MGDAALVRLRVSEGRAVLVGQDGGAEREVDTGHVALAGQLSEDLAEWARVACAVRRSEPPDGGSAGAVVSRRGLQLTARVAESLGVPVGYLDPLTGRETVVEPPAAPPAGQPSRPHGVSSESTPWVTGLTVSAFVLVVVLFCVLSLAATLAATTPILAVASHLVVTVGLLPSVWLVRRVLVWRWVAFGVAGALALAWLALPLIVF